MTACTVDMFDEPTDADDPRYVDEIAVERRCKGDHTVPLTRTEAAAAFHRLDNAGHSARDISERIGVAERTVVQWRRGVRPSSLSGRPS